MSNTFRLFVQDDNSVIDEDVMEVAGVDPSKAEGLFPGMFKIYEVWLHPATGRKQMEITAKCQKVQADGSTVYDVTLEPAIRAEVMIEKWNGPTERPTVDGFLNQHPNVCNAIDAHIRKYMYPNAFATASPFIKALSELQKSSETVTV